MSAFEELIGYAEQIFKEHDGKITLDEFKQILSAFGGERIRVPTCSKQQRLDMAKRLYRQNLPTDIINTRICQAFGVTRHTAWRDISRAVDEIRRKN